MKVEIRDVAAVKAIAPFDAALYLRAKGWKQQGLAAPGASLWIFQAGGQEFEALLPMDIETRDYALRMGDLLQVLAAAEGRSQSLVYNDLLMITADVVRIRIADPELNDGTLPIEEHVQIAQKARDLVLAAACAATESRPVWHKRKPLQAMEHVRQVRVGQSERGSYVITVMSRVTPALHPMEGRLFEAPPPYERQVTETLAQSLHSLDVAAQQAALTQEMASFDRAVGQGVNANLCDAVVGLWGGDERQRNLEFSFSFSPTRPASPDIARRVAFSSDRVPLIREAAKQMREREPLPDYEVHGPVIRLEREEDSPLGRVTLMGLVDDRQARISVELEEEPYRRAVEAHSAGNILHLSGTLVREGRGFALKDPRNLVVEPE
jgi:hypothetical protein